MKPKVGSIFTGIGGIDLGLERAGFEIAWMVEIDPYCRKVLDRHWPHVRKYADVHEVNPDELEPVDLLAGGFPCQPVSLAGKLQTQDDPRWLWPEFARFIRCLRPRFALMENVPGLLVRGMGDVLGDLASLGYDAEWEVLPAAAFGAAHLRERVFIVAYPAGVHWSTRRVLEESSRRQSQAQPRGFPSVPMVAAGGARGTGLEREPRLARLVHGVPHRMERLIALGNAVYPAVAEWIGRHIIEAMKEVAS